MIQLKRQEMNVKTRLDFMFIKPLDTSLLPIAQWQDHAGNTHFSLQSKKKDGMRSFFSGLTNLSLTSSQDAAYRKSIAEYDYRILLKINTRKQVFVIAVDESFEKIHTDWNWVERNLFLKVDPLI